jgi:hypothetical protein
MLDERGTDLISIYNVQLTARTENLTGKYESQLGLKHHPRDDWMQFRLVFSRARTSGK